MKRSAIVAGLVLLLASSLGWAQEQDDATAIRERIESYVAAYNQHDAEAVANHWAENALYIQRDTGERIQGRAGIAAMFAKSFQAEAGGQLSVTVDAIRLIPPNVAVEDGSAEIVTEGETLKSTYTAVHVKHDGVWYLDSVRETDTPAPPAAEHPAELQQLAWLVGEWVDEDENATVTTRWDWAKNNRFLTATFSVSIDGITELEGVQIIGWDPVAGNLRSWLFDSHGGFGDGVWRRAGNQWTVETTQTLSDGAQGSAVNVYTLVDDHNFTWKSVDRQLDGEAQDDIQEVNVRRK